MANKLYALLVGINEYHPKSESTRSLQGPANDVQALQDLLLGNYAHLRPSVITLLNEQATRNNIIEIFRNHLTAHANEEATLLFYFSGHGSRQAISEAFRPLRKNEKETTLVCYDSRNYKQRGLDLADVELAILIEEASQANPHVVIILDTEASGYDFNYVKDVLKQETFHRVTAGQNKREMLRRAYLDGYYEKMLEERGGIEIPQGKHVLLAACQEVEGAKEKTFEGKRRGVFSHCLEAAIKANPSLSYFDLFFQVKADIQKMNFPTPQNPFLGLYGGFDPHVPFLPTPTPLPPWSDQAFYPVEYVNKTWRVRWGLLHHESPDLSPKPIWKIYNNTHLYQLIATAQTDTVHTDHSSLKITEGDLDTSQEYWAQMVAQSQKTFELALRGSAEVASLLKTDCGSPLFRLQTEAAQDLSYQLELKEDTCTLFHKGEAVFDEKIEVEAIRQKLEKIAFWETLRQAFTPFTSLQPEDFGFRVVFKNGEHEIKGLGLYGKLEIDVDQLDYFDGEIEWGIPHRVFIQNNSKQELHFLVLDLGFNYHITASFSGLVPANSKEITPPQLYATLAPKQLFTFYIQLIVSTQELYPAHFTQSSLEDTSTNLEQPKVLSLPGDWLVKTLEVVVRRKS